MKITVGNASIRGDTNPFLRKISDWFEEWQVMQGFIPQKLTLSKQTYSTLVIIHCTDSLIDYLLSKN